MPGNILLLRSPSEDTSGPDKYEAVFRARGYRAFSIPVLETVFTNADELAQVVRAGGQRYAGVIVTSGRACEAWQAAVEHAIKTGGRDQSNEGWSTLPFYAVGQATASALSAIRTSFPTSPHAPHDIRGGAESGTAEKLAHFIVSDLSNSTHRRLLYLTGDKNRDTLPSILSQGGFELDSLQVYATQGSSRFGEDLKHALDGVQANGEHRCWRYARAMQLAEHPWWIVHFAPSSAKHVFPPLCGQFDMPMRKNSERGAARRHARIAAIGPTTSTFLEEELGVRVDVVPAKPTPEALAEAIAQWDEDHGV
ncbi:tetrapyrrole biosynthesis uroporphyrinogen III synthase [Earliella scabrosa]|nr:tetrapyrrole biosynthesis uroporphyrinogen III synthase [Earliella scabrosa]